jgi:GT2 family glycosyltransferase
MITWPPMTDGPVDVSIVLCTWNNSRRLALTLEAIGGCSVPAGVRWELVVVLNNCTDDTATVVRRLARQLPVVAVDEPRQGLSRARNTGLRAAGGRLVVFTDDDVSPCRDWVATYWQAYLGDPRGSYFGGRLVPDYEAGPPEPDLLPLASFPITGLDWGPRPRTLASHERFLGANWACPAEALRRAGEFDVRLGLDASLGRRRVGEEWDMMERLRGLGLQPRYLPEAVVRHFVPRHKCCLPYLAAGWEAQGHVAALRGVTTTPLLASRPDLRAACRGGPGLAGIPWRVYAAASRAAVRALLAGRRGRRGYQAYATLRFYVGVLRGHRERRRVGA